MKPVRDIPVQSRSVAGKIFSYKNERFVSYESQLELAFIYHLEFTPYVKSYVEQPIKLYYKKDDTKRAFVPDFLVYYTDIDRKPLLVEIKYSKEIQERRDYVKRKIAVIKSYAEENGMDFRLFTEKELSGNRPENYKFLYRYLPEPSYVIELSEIRRIVIDFVREKGISSPQEVINLFGNSLEEKAKILTIIWHLLANNVLSTDLNKPLTNGSLITLNANDRKNTSALILMVRG